MIGIAQQAGQQVLYPYDLANCVDANSVEDIYMTGEAISMLLKGTGLAPDLGATEGIVVFARKVNRH